MDVAIRLFCDSPVSAGQSAASQARGRRRGRRFSTAWPLPQHLGEKFGRTFRRIRAAFHMRSTGLSSDSMS